MHFNDNSVIVTTFVIYKSSLLLALADLNLGLVLLVIHGTRETVYKHVFSFVSAKLFWVTSTVI